MNAATRATIPTRVDPDGQPCRAYAGTDRAGAWGVYWALDGGRERDWIVVGVSQREALRTAAQLNARHGG